MSSGSDDFKKSLNAKEEGEECSFCPHLKHYHNSNGCTKCSCTSTGE